MSDCDSNPTYFQLAEALTFALLNIQCRYWQAVIWYTGCNAFNIFKTSESTQTN